MDGFLPAAIGDLTNCIFLEIASNRRLSGTIPSLGNLTQLQSLALGYNALTGPVPSLDNLTHLKYLFLLFNALTGSIPSLDKLT
jgi:Leucine-rich repeat (LRR) protein